MYQPRRVSQAPQDVPFEGDAASLAAFRSAPRRAARSRLSAVGARIAPASLSVALLATVGVIAFNPRPTDAGELVAVPERSDQVSRSENRDEAEPQRAIAESLSTENAAPEASAPTTAPVAAAWSARFGQAVGKKYAQSTTKVFAQASEDADVLAKLAKGDTIEATDLESDGFRQVVVDKKIGWVADDDLGNSAPKKETPAAKATKATAPTTYSGPSVLGLKPKAMVVYNAVTSNFKVPSVGGYRSSSLSSHQCGLAIDFMVYTNGGLGDSIASYLVANAGRLGITHMIWKQRIWTPYNPTWRGMADRGSITANHYDHVHVALADHC